MKSLVSMRINAFVLGVAVVLGAGAAQAQPESRGASAPPGSYWDSCRDVSTYGYGDNLTVSARCQDERGRWQGTTLRVGRCREMENRNGRLACSDQGRPSWGDDGRPPWSDNGRPPYGGGRPSWGRGSITLFNAPNFGGQPFQTQSEITNLPRQYNDRAMSLRIQGRGAWEVCADSDFRGRCQVFDRDVPDLRQYGLGEAVSSMRPVR